MPRTSTFPELFTIRLPAGGNDALRAVLREGETVSDAAREAVQTLVAEREWAAVCREAQSSPRRNQTFSHGRGRKPPGEKP